MHSPLVAKTRFRLLIAQLVFICCFGFWAYELVALTSAARAPARGFVAVQETTRPIITDRNGTILATQVKMPTLVADAAHIDNAAELTQALSKIFPDLNATRTKRLLSGNGRHVVLRKGLNPQQHDAVLHFGNPALHLPKEWYRVYPLKEAAAHVVGFASSDMRGLTGLEYALDNHADIYKADAPSHFATSIDVRVQHIMRASLTRAMLAFEAKAAGGIMMDVKNGEVIALASLPDFDANSPPAPQSAAQFNRMTLGVYELGSIFKILTAAIALESGVVDARETFPTKEPLQIGRYEISDVHGQERPLTLEEIVTYSSNVGSAQIALRLDPAIHNNFLRALNFDMRLSLDIPELATPIFPTRWGEVERVTASYGHGIAITPLHALAGVAAMVNGGIYYPPRLQKTELAHGTRIVSEQTSAAVRRMMRSVIVVGTGSKADVDGYPVLGKTGSADKPEAGGYSKDALITSFVGAFPAHDPRYALIVMLDEPQGTDDTFGYALAGWNAAPVASEIIRRAAPLLGVMPRLPDPQAKQQGEENAS